MKILKLGIAALSLVVVSCGDQTFNYFAPSQVVNQQGPNPNPSASPSPGTGVVRTVRIGEFGEQCPAGSGLQPAEAAPRQVRAGCTSAVTCTPLDAQGRQIPAQIPPRLDSFGVVAGEDNVIVEPFEDNAYNVSVFGRRANTTATLRCVVEGVPSPDWVIQVVP